MKKAINYLASAILGASVLLPFIGCNHKSDSKSSQTSNVQDSFANVRTTLEDFITSNETIEVVIGASSPTIADYVAAYEVRNRLDAEIQAWHTSKGSLPPNPTTDFKFDIDVPQVPYDKNRIFIGQESSNFRLATIRLNLNPVFLSLPPDTGVVEGYEFPTNKKAIVLTGKDMPEVLRAGRAVANYDKTINNNLIDLDGEIIYVTGPLDSIQTTVYKR